MNYKENLKFLIANGLGNVNKYTNSSLNELVDCEISKIDDKSEIVSRLLVLGISIMGVCFFLLVYLISNINKKYHILWSFIKTIAHESYFELRQSCLERLSLIHGAECIPEDTETVHRFKKLITNKIKFNFSTKFILRISILVIITGAYYALLHDFLYPECKEVLKARLKV